MANIGVFNPQAQEALGDFTPIPKGEWNCVITGSEVDQSNPNDPKLVLHFEVCEGAAKGGKFDVFFWIWYPSENNGKGKGDISRRKLTSITNALGIYQQFDDTAILHGKPMTVKTDIRWVPKKDSPGEMTGFPDPKSFNPYKGAQAAGADPVQPTAPAAPAQGIGVPGLQPAFGQAAFQPAFNPNGPIGQPAPTFAPPTAPVATQATAPQFQAPPQGFAPVAPAGMAPAPMAPAFGQQAQFQAPPVAAPQQFAPPAAPGFPPVAGAPAPGPWVPQR